MLESFSDKEDVFSNCVQIMEDWAHSQLLDSVEIDKERGVIIEEWRLGQGADQRMKNKYRPILFKGSRYAERSPIGKKEVLEGFKYNTIRQFYADWYRPDLMAIIAVGDFDIDNMEKIIKEKFSVIPQKSNPKKLEAYEMPDHKETLIAKVTDKEASRTTVMLTYKHPIQTTTTIADYRRDIIQNIYNTMINKRLEELQKLPDPPFNNAYTYFGTMTRTKCNYVSYAMLSDKGIERGIETLITENERVKKYGFTASEFERSKSEFLRQVEQQFNEKDKTESENLAFMYVGNFISNETAVGIEKDFELCKSLLPTIKLDEINTLAKKWVTNGENMVVVIQAPDKEGVVLPTDEKILKIIKESQKKEIKAFVDNVSTKPLLAEKPKAGKVIDEKKVKEADITIWTLSNGAKVIFKPSDFKNDEVLFSASSYGGSSLYPDKDYLSAVNAANIISNSGVGEFNKTQLDKYLTGKIANVVPYISELKEGLRGGGSPKDMETLLQLIYLNFTQPRKDVDAFKSVIERTRTTLQNKNAKPENVFNDSVKYIMSQKNYRFNPMNENMLKDINLDRAFEIYNDRFGDVGDFTFYFVGNIEEKSFKPLVETYLGGLPTKNRKETWKDLGIRPPKGSFEKIIYKGKEPKSTVIVQMTGDFDFTRKNRMESYTLTTLLNIKLMDAVREEKGGTYGVYSYINPMKYPISLYISNIQWGCAPDRTEELSKTAFQVVEDIKTKGVEDKDVTKVKETLKKERETSMKQNDWWLSTISNNYDNNENILEILDFDKFVETINSDLLKLAANKYYDKANFAKFILMPEKK